MYLSCLQLDIRSPAVRQCLKDCQDMHRTLMRGFPQASEGRSRVDNGVLYRVVRREHGIGLYVLSRAEPDWQAIADQGFASKEAKDVSMLPAAFAQGRRFTFDALLCPTKKVANPQGNSRRVFLASADERLHWLERKAQQNGFAIEWVREEGQNREDGAHGQNRGGRMHHTGVRFRGVLGVTDKEAFAAAFSNGIGSGKAYGFGLLMLFKA